MPRWPSKRRSEQEDLKITFKRDDQHWSNLVVNNIIKKTRVPNYTIKLEPKNLRTMPDLVPIAENKSNNGLQQLLEKPSSSAATMTAIPKEALERLRVELPGPSSSRHWPIIMKKTSDGPSTDSPRSPDDQSSRDAPPTPPQRDPRKRARPVRFPDSLAQQDDPIFLRGKEREALLSREESVTDIDDSQAEEPQPPNLICTERITDDVFASMEPKPIDQPIEGGGANLVQEATIQSPAVQRQTVNLETAAVANEVQPPVNVLPQQNKSGLTESTLPQTKQPAQTVNSNAVLISNTAQNVWLVHPIVTFPLQHLTRQGSYAELEKALKLGGLIIDIRDETNKTATMWAIELQRHMALDLLLREGADVNRQNALGDTLTHSCAKRGDYLGLSILNKFKPNYYKTNILGEIPMFSAMQSRDPEIIQRVWDYSEDVTYLLNHRAKGGYGLMHYCAVYGDTTMIRRICKHAKEAYQIVPMAESHTTPLHVAATKTGFACIESLINSWPVQTKIVDHKGRAPIHYVTNIEALSAFEKFNRHELTMINTKDGCSLAHYAAERGNAAVLAYLTRRVVNLISEKNLKGKTWLEIASPDTRSRVNSILLKELSG